jgi:hypothetical protein
MATRKRTARTVDELRPEYDLASLTGRVQGKYYERARAGSNLVLLEPEIAEAFPDSKSVNEALGLLLRVARTGRLRAHAHEKPKSGSRRNVARGRKARA